LAGIEQDPELMYWFTQRSKVKPGITGTWQVAKRGSLKMDDMIRLDIDYIQGWSLSADLVLLLRTIPAVTRRREAL
jgi:lipopolysaccharide/colanic/teichoic acid biosynthesis glycosyltransferase